MAKAIFFGAMLVLAGCLPPVPDGDTASSSAGEGTGLCGSGSWQPGWLEIHHIDAGEAASTLIVSPVGKTLLIDAGEASWDQSDGAKTIGAYVRGVLGCSRLDYVLLSHFHLDHVGFPGHGGLWHLVHEQGFSVGKLLHRDLFRFVGVASATLTSWRTYLQSADGQALHPEIAVLGSSQVQLGGGVSFSIVAVDGNGVLPAVDLSTDGAPPDENDYSIAALVRMGRFDYFTAGDLSGQTLVSSQGYSYHDMETRVAPKVKDVDVLRVSHHGSSHASNPSLLAELAPRISIIQVADGNTNGHPTQATVNRLLATSRLYLTEHGNAATDLRDAKVLGHVVVRTSTGTDYTVGNDRYVATDPARIDADRDGYFAEADPDDSSASTVPAENGGCDARYEACP
jgi:beta-lactamase superfamily II metal-dependent hydrolase